MDIRDIRLARLQLLLEEHGNSKKELAGTLKKAPAQVSQWFNRVRTISEDTARELERNAKLPDKWLDRPLAVVKAGSPASAPVTTLRAESPLPRPAWPLPRIDERKVAQLPPEVVRDLETAMLGAAAVLGVSIGKRKAA